MQDSLSYQKLKMKVNKKKSLFKNLGTKKKKKKKTALKYMHIREQKLT